MRVFMMKERQFRVSGLTGAAGRGVAVALSLAAALCFGVSAVRAAGGAPRMPQVKFVDYRLPNGLRVVLSPDHAAPVIAVSATYNVGSRNELPGHTGFAHLFEHMMFQGSANVGKGEHMMLIQENGGTMNGTTNQDRTNFFEELPANQLALALFLEADRMRSLDVSQANLDNQRAVVEEEKRQSYDNQPYGQMPEVVQGLAYSSFGYKHTTIGSMADLNAASLEDVRSFFRTYYAPNNAVVAVVGDFKESTARRLVQKYFGPIPRQPAPPVPDLTETPILQEQQKTIQDPLARLTRYEAAYKTVPGNNPDSYALAILGSILSSGRTGRLYNALVEKRLALNVSAGAPSGRGPGLFTFNAILPPGGDVDAVEKAIDAEILKIQQDGVTDEEMQRARMQARARTVVGFGGRGGGFSGLQTALGRANTLAQDTVFFNDPNRINTLLPDLEAVTAADVKRVAIQYLNPQHRVVVIDVPEASTDELGMNLAGARKKEF